MSFRDPNWLGRTASLITSGRCGADMRPSCRQGEHGNSYEQSCRGMVIAGLVALVWLSGCARLELIGEPEGAESQVTLDSLKAAVREGQRATTDLRTELADRRKELADAQVARAQLQGMLRETESRLTDARHIIELQREELAAARVDRERVEESGRQLHSRLRRLETRLAQARRQGEMIPSAYIPRHSGELAQSVHVSPQRAPSLVGQPAMATEPFSADPIVGTVRVQAEADVPRIIIVREGDTLWRLARRHGVDLEELRQINALQDTRIVAGWTLRLPVPVSAAEIRASGPQLMER